MFSHEFLVMLVASKLLWDNRYAVIALQLKSSLKNWPANYFKVMSRPVVKFDYPGGEGN